MSAPASGDGAAPARAGWPFSMVQHVRFGDLDAMQHMNNVVYLRYFETARIEYIRHALPGHHPTGGFGFIFAECWIAYRSPAQFDDAIRTWVRPNDIRRSSVRVEFEMVVDGEDRLVAEGWGVLVGYDYREGRVARLPAEARERLMRDAPEALGQEAPPS